MTPEIRFLLIALRVKLVGPRIELPINMLGAFPLVIYLVFSEFCGETMKGTFMDAADKAFHDLIGQEVQILEQGSLM